MLIYFLEDDASIAYIIEKTVMNADFQVKGFNKGEALLSAVFDKAPDLLLLDMMLPDISGLEVLKKVRTFYKNLPVIMISALSSEMDKVKALDAGADDYMTKPFGILELTSRINAQFRKQSTEKIYEKNNLVLNRTQHKCFINGQKINLTTKEFDILLYLLRADGKVVTKELLFNEIWNMDVSIETRTLDMHMKSLRQKIKDADFEIKTIRGVGYSL